MGMIKRTAILFLVFLMLLNIVNAYQLSFPVNTGFSPVDLDGQHFLTVEGDVNSILYLYFELKSTYEQENVTWYIYPVTPIERGSVVNFSANICSSYSCAEKITVDIKDEFGFGSYTIIADAAEVKDKGYKYLVVNYYVEDFVQIQSVGNYFLILENTILDSGNKISDSNVRNSIFLPSPREGYKVSNLFGRKVTNDRCFVDGLCMFEGRESHMIQYYNQKEIDKKERVLQMKYTFFGLILGFILSIALLFFERGLFDFTPYGNKISFKLLTLLGKIGTFKNVRYGNTNTKRFHKSNCSYMDNIGNHNREPFSNEEDATKKGFSACSFCCIINSDDKIKNK